MARVALLLDQMFEDDEFRIPYDRVSQAGHRPTIVGIRGGQRLTGKRGTTVLAELSARDASPELFDALVIPGGYSPDRLRTDIGAVRFTREMFLEGKPVAAVCHAGSMLVEADIADGRTVTSWPSIKTDLLNAGAKWIDREVVVDGNLITSRKPDDLPAFCHALLERIDQSLRERAEAHAEQPLGEAP